MGRIYVDRYTGTIERTDLYLVKLTLKDGTVYEDLEPRMLFPFTNHEMFITLLDKNEKELGFVRALEELNDEWLNKAQKLVYYNNLAIYYAKCDKEKAREYLEEAKAISRRHTLG